MWENVIQLTHPLLLSNKMVEPDFLSLFQSSVRKYPKEDYSQILDDDAHKDLSSSEWKKINQESLELYKTRAVHGLPETKETECTPRDSFLTSQMNTFTQNLDDRRSDKTECGSKDVLIFISQVCNPAEAELQPHLVSFRKKGQLNKEDMRKLKEEGVPSHTWQFEAKMLEFRYRLERSMYNVVGVFDDRDLTPTAVLRQITDICKSTTRFGSTYSLRTSDANQLE